MTTTQEQLERLKCILLHESLNDDDRNTVFAAIETLEKLPQTADGVCVVPGMAIHVPGPWLDHVERVESIDDSGTVWSAYAASRFPERKMDMQCCYSTREAAEASARHADEESRRRAKMIFDLERQLANAKEREKRLVDGLRRCRKAVRRPENAGEQTVELITRQALADAGHNP